MSSENASFDYDFVVIGGGSGGLSSAKAASALGARVAVFDFVKPSPRGSRWGLGGTCVNVGCVPKKLMHFAGSLRQAIAWDAPKFGWEGGFTEFEEETGEPVEKVPTFNWQELVATVQAYVKQLNFGYRTGLRAAGCTYINALATIVGPNRISYEEKGEKKTLTAKHILVAVGGRPHVPTDVPGASEFAITSDDLFSLKKTPGRTLVVGASYIALECAGVLTELGFDVTVAVRSILLRGFDRQCAEKVGSTLEETGTKFLKGFVVSCVETLSERGPLKVTLRNGEGETRFVEVDTLLYATGRRADTRLLGLGDVGVALNKEGEIVCREGFQTSIPSIFAIGDAVEGFPQLTPAAIKAGEVLARRLFGGSSEVMDYENIPTTVFTPFEYGCVGLSEEKAVAKYGEDGLEIYLNEFSPLEISASHVPKHARVRTPEDAALTPPALCKVICIRDPQDSTRDGRIVGLHFVGPNAGEVVQGFAVALRLGAKKADLDATVGIHPTNAEAFTQLAITKRSGLPFRAAGGCGGGKCG